MKKILVIDDKNFSKICRGILEMQGFFPEILLESESLNDIGNPDYDLVIAGYPYVKGVHENLMKMQTPVLILTDFLNGEIMGVAESFNKSRCMIRPLDYDNFISVVGEMMKC